MSPSSCTRARSTRWSTPTAISVRGSQITRHRPNCRSASTTSTRSPQKSAGPFADNRSKEMATIRKEIKLDARPDDVWDALRDFHAVHERLVPGFVSSAERDGDDARIVTFFNGAVARE